MSKHTSLVADLIEQVGPASNHPEDALFITEQCVCHSNAGYYVGTWCIEAVAGSWLPQPYSRDSGYFLTQPLAEAHYAHRLAD
jgi:hypothetical protein